MAEMRRFYEAHRSAMAAAMRQRPDLAEAMLRERTPLSDKEKIRQDVMCCLRRFRARCHGASATNR